MNGLRFRGFIHAVGFGVLFVCLTMTSITCHAAEFQRRILGIYASEHKDTYTNNQIRNDTEFMLNYLGLTVDYHDISSSLPSMSQLRPYRGVIISMTQPQLRQAHEYWSWLSRVVGSGKYVVLLNKLGPAYDTDTGEVVALSRINRVLRPLGLRQGPDASGIPDDIEVSYKDPQLMDFERGLEDELFSFLQVSSIASDNVVALTLRKKSTGNTGDLVVLMPRGAIALEDTLRYEDPFSERRQWRVNPFVFFSQAFGLALSPRPDVTTENGSRLFYTHVDGDGFSNQSYVNKKKMSAEILVEQVFEPKKNIPFTLSVITGELGQKGEAEEDRVKVAKHMFALSHVEPASHTLSHPIIWDRKLFLQQYGKIDASVYPNLTFQRNAAVSWKLSNYRFNPRDEIIASAKYIKQQLLPKRKSCKLLLWSGNCFPNMATLALAHKHRILNINGGDSRFDALHPSYLNLSPLTRKVGKHLQVFSSNANENLYTNHWTDPFGGYRNVLQTFQNTETPRRVSPINVYYHHYSGERIASLQAIKDVYDWVATQRVFPIYTSQYIRKVHGFIATKIRRLGTHTWQVTDNGDCRTLRFDNTQLVPQLEGGVGVLGYRQYQGNLYVHLDESNTHTIRLATTPPSQPYLHLATAPVTQYNSTASGWEFSTQSLAHAQFEWNNLDPKTTYRISIQQRRGKKSVDAESDAMGRLSFNIPLFGKARVSVQPKTTKVAQHEI